VAKLLDAITGYDPNDPFTVTASAAPTRGLRASGRRRGASGQLARRSARDRVRSTQTPRTARQPGRARAVAGLQAQGVAVTADLEIDELANWISGTSVYAIQSRLTSPTPEQAPTCPVSSFDEIYASGRFDPLNDLFTTSPRARTPPRMTPTVCVAGSTGALRRLILNMFATNEIDFMVYPTVQVLPPTHRELARRSTRR